MDLMSQADGFGDSCGGGEGEEDVDVVFDAADGEGGHVVFASDSADVGPKARGDVGGDEGLAMFGGEDAVHQAGDKGVRYGEFPVFVRGSQIGPVGTVDNSPPIYGWTGDDSKIPFVP